MSNKLILQILTNYLVVPGRRLNFLGAFFVSLIVIGMGAGAVNYFYISVQQPVLDAPGKFGPVSLALSLTLLFIFFSGLLFGKVFSSCDPSIGNNCGQKASNNFSERSYPGILYVEAFIEVINFWSWVFLLFVILPILINITVS